MDQQESDLGILDLIQVFVEALDKCFENVCELDLIFHSDKVHYILDEIIMAGMVLETNINHILASVNDQHKLHVSSMKINSSISPGNVASNVVATGAGSAMYAANMTMYAASLTKETGSKILSSLYNKATSHG